MARIAAAGVAACVLVGVAIMTDPGAAAPLWAAAGAASVTGILYGVHQRQPAHRGPWLLLAASVGAMAAGDVAFAFDKTIPILVAEIFYLAMFPLLGAALLLLTRANPALRDRSTVVDLLCSSSPPAWSAGRSRRARAATSRPGGCSTARSPRPTCSARWCWSS